MISLSLSGCAIVGAEVWFWVLQEKHKYGGLVRFSWLPDSTRSLRAEILARLLQLV